METLAEKALFNYENHGIHPIFPQDLDIHDAAVWQCVFEDHPELWIEIEVLNNRNQALASLENYVDAPNAINIIGHLAHGNLEHLIPNSTIKEEYHPMLEAAQLPVLQVWLETFSSVPEFISSLFAANDLHAQFFPEEAKVLRKLIESAL